MLLRHLVSLLFSPKCTLGKEMKHLLYIILSVNPSSFGRLRDNNGRGVLFGNLTRRGGGTVAAAFIQKAEVEDESKGQRE